MLVRIIDVPKKRGVKDAWSTIIVIIAIMITLVPEDIAIMIIMIIMIPEERGAEDAKGEEEAEREAEEERGEDRERDQHRVPGHTHVFTSLRGSSRYHCVSSKQNVVEVMAWLTHQMSDTLV